jgi:hypothetical protein
MIRMQQRWSPKYTSSRGRRGPNRVARGFERASYSIDHLLSLSGIPRHRVRPQQLCWCLAAAILPIDGVFDFDRNGGWKNSRQYYYDGRVAMTC